MNFQAKLSYLIAWVLRIPIESISESTDLRKDLYLEDVDFDLMIFRFEYFYKTEFTPDQIKEI